MSTTRRQAVLFVAGLLGVVHETLLMSIDRPALLALFGGMTGLPLVLHADRKKNGEA